MTQLNDRELELLGHGLQSQASQKTTASTQPAWQQKVDLQKLIATKKAMLHADQAALRAEFQGRDDDIRVLIERAEDAVKTDLDSNCGKMKESCESALQAFEVSASQHIATLDEITLDLIGSAVLAMSDSIKSRFSGRGAYAKDVPQP